MSQEKHKQTSQGKGKVIMKKGNEVSDLTKEYGASFSVLSHEKGKKFHSRLKRKFTLPKFFDNDVLYDIGVDKDMVILSDKLGWTKFFKMKHDTLYDLTLEFYITFEILNDD